MAAVKDILRRFYVYIIFRWDGSPCYVGKGRGDRWLRHAKNSTNRHLGRIYAQAGGTLPIIKVREGLTHAEACETEIALIIAIGRADLGRGPLVNFTDGGEGMLGHRPSPETCEKIASSHRGRPLSAEHKAQIGETQRGKPKPDGHGAKVAAALIGHVISEATRAKIGAANRGQKRSPEQVERMRIVASSPDVVARLRAANLGKRATPEARAKMIASRKGKPSPKPPGFGATVSAAIRRRKLLAQCREGAGAGPLFDYRPESDQ